MKRIKLIGITGRAGSGKDTAGGYLRDFINTRKWRRDRVAGLPADDNLMNHFAMRDSIAEPLRDMTAQFGFTRSQITDRELKEQMVAELQYYSPRSFMQKLGDMLRREFGADVLLKMLVNRMEPRRFYIITDVRTDDEAAFIRARGGAVIEIEREQAGLFGETGLHITEQGIDPALVYWRIYNNGSLEELQARVKEFIDSVELEFGSVAATDRTDKNTGISNIQQGMSNVQGEQTESAVKMYVLHNFGNIQDHSWKRYYIPQIIDDLRGFDLEEIKHSIKKLCKEHSDSALLEPTSEGVMCSIKEKYIHIANQGYHSHLNINVKLIYELQMAMKQPGGKGE